MRFPSNPTLTSPSIVSLTSTQRLRRRSVGRSIGHWVHRLSGRLPLRCCANWLPFVSSSPRKQCSFCSYLSPPEPAGPQPLKLTQQSTHRTFSSKPGGRHLRLAWVESPPDLTQGWPGRRGPARVRVDTALRSQDPAVLIMPGPTAATAASDRDPVVDLRACAIPPHFVQPWATIEVVRDSGGVGEEEGEEEGKAAGGTGKERPNASAGDTAPMAALRPEFALGLLRGCTVRTGGVAHLLTAATDPACRGVRLLCRRAPEFVVPPLPVSASEAGAPSSHRRGVATAAGGHRRSRKQPGGGGRPPGAGGQRTEGGGRGAREQQTKLVVEVRDGAGAGRGPAGEDGDKGRQRPTRGAETAPQGGRQTGVGYARHGTAGEGGRGAPPAAKGGAGDKKEEEKEGDWAHRLSEWGVVTTGSEVVVPHKALEVCYHDARRPASAPRGEPAWVEAVLRSHEPSVVDDLSAGLGLDPATPRCPSAGGGGEAEEAGEEDERTGPGDTGAGNAALLVHGPPGVGKTRLVRKCWTVGGGGARGDLFKEGMRGCRKKLCFRYCVCVCVYFVCVYAHLLSLLFPANGSLKC